MRLSHALFSALVLQLTLSLGMLGLSTSAVAQIATPTPATPSLPGRPLWSDLSESQQQALGPLYEQWHTMNEPHKRKWLVLSQNFTQLSADEQATLQGRMREWAALSPQKRAAARLNFAGVQKLPQEDKKAKWEAYQALSPEAKQKLAAQQPTQPVMGAAPAAKPVSTTKLATPPTGSSNKALPRIATDLAAPTTLLPTPAISSAPASAGTESNSAPQ